MLADWLEEYGTTEADRARVELVRLWFNLRPGLRSTTKSIGKWLGANWTRLWPTVAAAATLQAVEVKARGRSLTLQLLGGTALKGYFSGGFAERVQFGHGNWYSQFGRAVAADEPLAFLSQELSPPTTGALPGTWCTIHRNDWGPEVFDRLVQFDEQPDADRKVYSHRDTEVFVPCAVWHPSHRAQGEISAAMTAIARTSNGLDQSAPAEV